MIRKVEPAANIYAVGRLKRPSTNPHINGRSHLLVISQCLSARLPCRILVWCAVIICLECLSTATPNALLRQLLRIAVDLEMRKSACSVILVHAISTTGHAQRMAALAL